MPRQKIATVADLQDAQLVSVDHEIRTTLDYLGRTRTRAGFLLYYPELERGDHGDMVDYREVWLCDDHSVAWLYATVRRIYPASGPTIKELGLTLCQCGRYYFVAGEVLCQECGEYNPATGPGDGDGER